MLDAHAIEGRPSARMPKRACWLLAGVCWALSVLAGMTVLIVYRGTPGAASATPAKWPSGSIIPRRGGAATLVMFAHPHCPCTRASVAELARILARAPRDLDAFVAFTLPEGVEPGWEKSETWRSASAMPSVTVLVDRDGAEGRRFGAVTSGHAVLYEAGGGLLFSGGITGGRGHEGQNFGRRRVEALLEGLPTDRGTSPVFGCQLE